MMKNKKNNKKIIVTFVVVMIVLYVIGYAVGSAVAGVQSSFDLNAVVGRIKDFFGQWIPFIFAIVSLLGILIPVFCYIPCKSMYEKLQKDKDNDDLWDALEVKLNLPMVWSNVFAIIEVFFFFSFMYVILSTDYGKDGGYPMVVIIVDFALFILAAVTEILIPKLTLDIEKKLNPEKEGNVLDFSFRKVWMDSCDEAQKMAAYKAGYQAFLNTNIGCIIMIIMNFVLMFILDIGIYPLMCICIIWLVNNLSYMLRAVKLEKGAK